MITFPESMSRRISRENGRAGHPLSDRKTPEYPQAAASPTADEV